MALVTPDKLTLSNLMKNPELQNTYRYVITNGKVMILNNFGTYSFMKDAVQSDYGLYPEVDTTSE